MAELNVYIKGRFLQELAETSGEFETIGTVGVRTGVLTDEVEEASDDVPVIVEDVTERIYTPGELPPDTVVYVPSDPEGHLPPLAVVAREAGFDVRPATEFGDVDSEPDE